MWQVYVDWTREEKPRPFYVGKGSPSRVADLRRGEKHTRVSTELGVDRKVVLTTRSTPEAKQKIREARLGKSTPHTEETKRRMSEAKKGLPPNNKGKTLCTETRAKMSQSRKGRPKSEEWKYKMSLAMMGNTNGKRKTCQPA